MKNQTNSNRFAWISLIRFTLLVLFMILISGCGLIDTSSGKCGEEVIDKTTYKYKVTLNELLSGVGPFFQVGYSNLAGGTSRFEITRIYKDCRCYEDEFGNDLWTEASAYIYTPIESKGGCTVSGYADLGLTFNYTFVRSGSDPNMTHFYGTHNWLDLSEEEKCVTLRSILLISFPAKGTIEDDARFVVDSLRLGLYFMAKYAKPK